MTRPVERWRAAALATAAVLMAIGTVGYALVVAPHLHEDLVEIGVRPTLVRGTVLYLYFAAMAMAAFTIMVAAAAIEAMRGQVPARLPLVAIALINIVYGGVAFSRSLNPHHFAPVFIGILLAAAVALPRARGDAA